MNPLQTAAWFTGKTLLLIAWLYVAGIYFIGGLIIFTIYIQSFINNPSALNILRLPLGAGVFTLFLWFSTFTVGDFILRFLQQAKSLGQKKEQKKGAGK